MAVADVPAYNRVITKKMPWWASFKKVRCPECGQFLKTLPSSTSKYRLFTCKGCKILIKDLK